MDRGATERPPMAHPQEPTRDRTPERLPMVSKKQGLSRRIQVGLAKIGLIATAATGGAGVVHHVTGVELGGPIPVGATVDTAVVDNIIKSSNSEPQLTQEAFEREKAVTEILFQPNFARLGGEIEIPLANFSEARTKDVLFAIRMGTDYKKVEVDKISSVDGKPTGPGSTVAIGSPTMVDLTGEGLGRYYLTDMQTADGVSQDVLIPELSAEVITPGEIVPLYKVPDSSGLDATRIIPPTH